MSVMGRRLVRLILRSISANPVTRHPLRELARRGLLPEAVWRRLPVECAFSVRLGQGAGFRYVSSQGDQIGRALYWRGLDGYEAETLRVFIRLVKDARYFLDIGANTGVFSLVACAVSAECRTAAFEPVPKIRDMLMENIRLNHWNHRCEVRGEAVADRDGITRFHVPSALLPTSASLNREGFRCHKGHMIDVPVITIDSFCSDGRDVDLIKLDVEGFEDKALEGMRGMLERCRPDLIVECNYDGPYQAVERILLAHGYRFYHLGKEEVLLVPHIRPDPAGVFRNYLCTARGSLKEAKV